MLFLFTLDIQNANFFTLVKHFLSIMARDFEFRALKWSKWFTAVKKEMTFFDSTLCAGIFFDAVSKNMIAHYSLIGGQSTSVVHKKKKVTFIIKTF